MTSPAGGQVSAPACLRARRGEDPAEKAQPTGLPAQLEGAGEAGTDLLLNDIWKGQPARGWWPERWRGPARSAAGEVTGAAAGLRARATCRRLRLARAREGPLKVGRCGEVR